jgi:hypothetical protein
VTLKSDYARAYHYLGLVMIDLGRYEEAAAALVKAYTYNPGWAETYYNYVLLGDPFWLLVGLSLAMVQVSRQEEAMTSRTVRDSPHNVPKITIP